jgi:mannosyltransferase OCH1-like enzyme
MSEPDPGDSGKSPEETGRTSGSSGDFTRIIHQSWKDENLPYHVYKKEWIDSWLRYNPDWEYRLWTDEDNNALVGNHFEWFLPTFEKYSNIQKADAARYFYLYKYGGLYVDLDFECLRNIEPLLKGWSIVLGEALDGIVHPAFMYSEPGHPFWEMVHTALVEHFGPDVIWSTGPRFITRQLWRSYSLYRIRVCAEELYPYNWRRRKEIHQRIADGERSQEMFPEAYAVHHWGSIWRPEMTVAYASPWHKVLARARRSAYLLGRRTGLVRRK